MTAFIPFNRVVIVGLGLIGSSLARAIKAEGLAGAVAAIDANPAVCARGLELGIVDAAAPDPALAEGADLAILCVPVGAMAAAAAALAPHLPKGAILTDVGSVKQTVLRDVAPHVPQGVHFIPGHPIAGTEHSGPDAGFAELFRGRWALLTPLADSPPDLVDRLDGFWRACGSKTARMAPEHHDKVLSITSHLPHLIAYCIVHTATGLADETKSEVIEFSASGFRDFTRIAASDPVMWRDIFLNNREAVLEMVQRFSEDLAALQRAIRRGEGEFLESFFSDTRAIRRRIIDARQA